MPYVQVHIEQGDVAAITSSCLLLPDGDQMVTLIHHDYDTVEGELCFPAGCQLSNFLTGDKLREKNEADGVRVPFTLDSWGYLQIRVHR